MSNLNLPTEAELKAEQEEVLAKFHNDPLELAHAIVVLRHKLIAARNALHGVEEPIP